MDQKLKTVAFINTNIIPMDRERVLENQTVIVEGDRITTIGPVDEVNVPDEADMINGSGAYLMPGLADMHTHIVSINQTFEGPDQLHLYLAQGVTTLRNLSALPEQLVWSDEINQGKRLGPTLYNGRMVVGLPEELQSVAYTFRAIVILAPVVIGLVIWLLLWAGFSLTGNSVQFETWSKLIVPSLGILLLLGGIAAWFKIIPLNVYASRAFPFATFPKTASKPAAMSEK